MNVSTSIHRVTKVTQQQILYPTMTVTNLFIKQSNGETFTLSLFNEDRNKTNWVVQPDGVGGTK